MVQIQRIQIYIYNIMLILLFFIFCITNQYQYFRLSNKEQNTFTTNDTLISTLGYYKLNLLKDKCQFSVSNFTGVSYTPVLTNYQSVNIFPSIQACDSLTIDSLNGQLFTNLNTTYLKVGGPCDYITFSIDDTGYLRLICINYQNETLTKQLKISNFYSSQPFVFCQSNRTIDQKSRLNTVTNFGEWQLYAVNQTLTLIMDSLDPTSFKKNITYNYPKFRLSVQNIYDYKNNQFPYTLFSNINLNPKCNIYSNQLKAPYIFVFDQYWPIFRVLDHSGYEILKLQYPNMSCLNLGIQNSLQRTCTNFVCPIQAYQLSGTCVFQCPFPYFYSIKSNEKRCVLNCQQGAMIDNANRICSCDKYVQKQCPSLSIGYPGGCRCKSRTFYDGFDCVSTCVPGTLGIRGVCVSCPRFCSVCQLSNNSISNLTCVQCIKNFILNLNGICQQKCNPYQGQTINNNDIVTIDNNIIDNSTNPVSYANATTCLICVNQNCINCMMDQNYCTMCNSISISWSGICITMCSGTDIMVYQSYSQFTCITPVSETLCKSITSNYYNYQGFLKCMFCSFGFIYKDRCVTDCELQDRRMVNDAINKVCKCKYSGEIFMVQSCRKISSCPINMYYNSTQNACLSCDYGCTTCQQYSNKKVCTSCAPEFLLFISLNPYCLISSFLIKCNQGFIIQNNVCKPKNINDSYKNCLSNISNCNICYHKSNTICLLCNTNFYLYNNVCYSQCPNNTFEYNNVCAPNNPMDQNCINNSISNYYQYALLKNTSRFNNTAYNYYTFNNTFPRNNPIGYIYQQTTANNKTDETLRESFYAEATYICLKCTDYFGIHRYDPIQCRSCPNPCKTCIYSEKQWCTSCIEDYEIVSGRICQPKFPICNKNQYRDVYSNCVNYCSGFELIQNINRINCSQSCPDNTYPILNPTSGSIICINDSTYSYTKVYSSIFKKKNGYIKVYFFPDHSFKNISNFTKLDFSYLTRGKIHRMLQKIYISITKQYILLINNYDPNITAFVLNFTQILPQSGSVRDTYLPSAIYGINTNLTRTSLITQQLFYTGLFLSIILFILQIIHIGNYLLYKVDNIIIFLQSIHYFLYNKQVLSVQLSQFYYGLQALHLGFIPNLLQPFIPINYIQYSPLSFIMVNQDANILRNAGYSFTFLVLFNLIFFAIAGILYLIKSKFFKDQVWNFKLLKFIYLGVVEIVIMNIAFFSMTQLIYGHYNKSINKKVYYVSLIISILSLVVILIYMIYRLYCDKIAGIYVFKRVILAFIMALTHNNNFCYLIILVEITFFFVRIGLEQPYTNTQHSFLYTQEFLIIIGYMFSIFCVRLEIIIIGQSTIAFLFICVITYDLTNLYLKNENWTEKVKEQKKMIEETVPIPDTQRLVNN